MVKGICPLGMVSLGSFYPFVKEVSGDMSEVTVADIGKNDWKEF